MSALDTLPPDQRAVLQLVLQQGRSYDDLASLLGISPEAVRARAHAGLEALGPDAGGRLSDARRELVSDYLLGQLPFSERETAREYLAGSAGARGWARVLAGELEPVSRGDLPEIPEGGDGEPEPSRTPAPAPEREEQPDELDSEPEPEAEATTRTSRRREAEQQAREPERPTRRRVDPADESDVSVTSPRASRLGGALLLAGLGILAVVLLIALLSGGDDKKKSSAATGTTPPAATTTGATGATGVTGATGPNQTRAVAQANLTPVSGFGTKKTLALLQLVVQGTKNANFLIAAQNLPALKSGTYYGVWLYNSATQARFVAPIVAKQLKGGRIAGLAPVPQQYRDYQGVVMTVQTGVPGPKSLPKTPGPIVLQGSLQAVQAKK